MRHQPSFMSDSGLWSPLTGLTGHFTSTTVSLSVTSQASHCANVDVCRSLMKERIWGLLVLHSKLREVVTADRNGRGAKMWTYLYCTSHRQAHINVFFSLTCHQLHGRNFMACQDSLRLINSAINSLGLFQYSAIHEQTTLLNQLF